jgi:hypothetical protein
MVLATRFTELVEVAGESVAGVSAVEPAAQIIEAWSAAARPAS